VGLTPAGVALLSRQGIPVLVERHAGEGSGFSDESYRAAGAGLVDDAGELYQAAGVIQKIKEPLPSEYAYFRPGQMLFSFLHLAAPAACDLVQSLRNQKVTALAYETLEKNGTRPLLAPMSEIAGALSILYAGFFLNQGLPDNRASAGPLPAAGSLEKIAAFYPGIASGIKAGKILIFGGGIAGSAAARYALKIGCNVSMVEKSPERRNVLKTVFQTAGPQFRVYEPVEVEGRILAETDIWIGSVHQTGKRAVHVLDSAAIAEASHMKRKIIMDISIDQGGNFIQARPTSYEIPFYYDTWGNVRFCVPNIPSLAGPYASAQMTNFSLPYTRALAQGIEKACLLYPELTSAINTRDGMITLAAVREAHGL